MGPDIDDSADLEPERVAKRRVVREIVNDERGAG
jgi:hypothetical protein